MATGKSNIHTVLVKQILIALGKMPELTRVWQNDVGLARSMDGKRVVRFGLNGSADITGILKGGKRIELEVKTGNAVQSSQQKKFEGMIHHMGGFYKVVRSVEEATEFVKKNAPTANGALITKD